MQEIINASVGHRVQNANLASIYAKLFWAPTWYQFWGTQIVSVGTRTLCSPAIGEFLGLDHRTEAVLRLETSSKSHDDDNSEILNGPLEEQRYNTMLSSHGELGRPRQGQGNLAKLACSWPIFRTCS